MDFNPLLEKLQKVVAPVVGNFYMDFNAQCVLQDAKVGDKFILKFNPQNKFDTNAIEVYPFTKNILLGHLDKISAKKISTMVEDFICDSHSGLYGRSDLWLTGTIKSTKGRVMVVVNDICLGD